MHPTQQPNTCNTVRTNTKYTSDGKPMSLMTARNVQGVLVAQWLGRRTSDPAVLGSIPRPRVIKHLGQLSLPSLRGR